MPVVNNRLMVLSIALSIAFFGVRADDKEPHFSPGSASSYPTRQTSEKVTIAAVPYTNEEQVRLAFGKVDPNKYGILPVLVVIQNDSGQALRLDAMRVEYVTSDRTHVDSTPAKDVPYLHGTHEPKITPSPLPGGGSRVKHAKIPLANAGLDVRAFAAKMLPPGDTASGFFYFQTGNRHDARAYVTGLKEAASGRELLYFEIPLSHDGVQ
jgi:hypothetical protein